MLSLTTMSPFEKLIDEEVKHHYGKKNPRSAPWERLTPWAKEQWCKLFWKEKLDE